MALLDILHRQEDEHQVESFCCVEETPPTLQEQRLLREDDELSSLTSKESQHHHVPSQNDDNCFYAVYHRREAVEWILRVVSHFSFTALTAVLAVNYLDRFDGLDSDEKTKRRKPWMTQLAAVSCLSLAAKVEETHVPSLLDLQVEESKYVFDTKTIQRMELLILSTLQWRMNPVIPFSFLDYATRKLRLNNHLRWEFRKRCESLLLCSLPDSRFRCYLPSVMATATMMHVINSGSPCVGTEAQSQLLTILGIINKEKVEDCCKQIQEMTCGTLNSGLHFSKRKFGSVPRSPNRVMDPHSSSNDSWSLVATTTTTANPSVSSSPAPLSNKRRRRAD